MAGGLFYLPGNRVVVFSPDADFAYGGTVLVEAAYDSETLARLSAGIRPLPIFVRGLACDPLDQTPADIEVELTELGRRGATGRNGLYRFGFGEPAVRNLPGVNTP